MSGKIPRTKEELLEINGIGKGKLAKYGDRILETIEAANDNNDIKRKRDGNNKGNENFDDDDFTKSIERSKKKAPKRQNKTIKGYSYAEPHYPQLIDDELDLYGSDFEVNTSDMKTNQNAGGRVDANREKDPPIIS